MFWVPENVNFFKRNLKKQKYDTIIFSVKK